MWFSLVPMLLCGSVYVECLPTAAVLPIAQPPIAEPCADGRSYAAYVHRCTQSCLPLFCFPQSHVSIKYACVHSICNDVC